MKNRKQIIINFAILCVSLFIGINVSAKVPASIKCSDTKVVKGNTFKCDVTVSPTTENPLSQFKSNLVYPSDFTLTGIEAATGWKSNSQNLIDLTSNYEEGQGLTIDFNIVTLKFKVSDNASYGNKQITIKGYDTERESSFNLEVLSNNSSLRNLTVGGIDFSFSPKQLNYSLKTSKDSISINATLMDTNSKFKEGYGPRTVDLNYGKNTVQVVVIAQNGSTTIYTINIERLDQRSSNNNLKELKVSEGVLSPKFNKNVLSYNVSVSNNVKNLTIEAKKEVESSQYQEGYGPRTIDLVNGLTTVTIQVVSETGITKTYTLNIVRVDKSSNNFLKGLKVIGTEFNFDKNIYEYNVNVLYNVLETQIIAVPEDNKTKVEVIGNRSLLIGANDFTINCIAENGSVLTYKVRVNRLEEGRELSKNNYLSELVISGYNIDFNKEVENYKVKIKQEDRLSISYTAEDKNSQIQVEGNNALKNGSIIKITVKSESGLAKVYSIEIVKDEEKSGNLLYIILGLIAILLLLLFLFRKKIFKKKEDQIISSDYDILNKLVLNKETETKPTDINTKNTNIEKLILSNTSKEVENKESNENKDKETDKGTKK